MKFELQDYAVFLVMQATANQPKDARRVDIGAGMNWTRVAAIGTGDFNLDLQLLEAEIERAKRVASVEDRDMRAGGASLKQRDQTRLDRELAAQSEPAAPFMSDRDLADFDADEVGQASLPADEEQAV